ncbi:phage major tail tube protein [Dyella sp. ASV21]|uniref:phage major tail tube protein n=1 Tax=Dyella sp. ASV21 TaxID=2795114 RepID=UPI0018EAAFEE|nr:phage major tail tube protein [Dyella sp. ASV21]
MALPKNLKNFDVFQDGKSWLGQVSSLTLPKLARKMEEFRAGGMDSAIKLDTGGEAMQMTINAAGYLRDAIRKFGTTRVDGVQLRFAGAYQSESSGDYDSVEIVTRGRYSEIDRGDAKPAQATEHKFQFEVAYYKESVNGQELIEIDVLNNIFRVDGVDLLAAQRAAMGHW